MEELFLRTLFASEELDVVDQARIHRTVKSFEFVDGVVLEGLHHIAYKACGVQIDDGGVGLALQHDIADRMHEMCLSLTDAAVDKERVIGRPRILSDLQGGGTSELIGFAFHEIVEGKFGTQIDHTPATATGIGLAAETGVGRRNGNGRSRGYIGADGGACRRRPRGRPYLQGDLRRLAVVQRGENLTD